MKKFSWILALILALSVGFIGCPSGDDDGDTPSPQPGPVGPPAEPPFVPNADAPVINITFGEGSTQTQVLFEKAAGSTVGEVEYADGGYTYTYGTADANYGNAIGRFMVDLGEFRLGDYGGIEFKWKGISGDVGLSPNAEHPEYTKNLFILGSHIEDDITPWKSDDDVAALIINTDYFKDGLTGKKLYDGAANVPCVKGQAGYPEPDYDLEPYTIATPFVLKKTITGEVFLAFYFHSTGGSYSVSDVKLIPAASFVKKDPPAAPSPIAPPTDPTEIPDGYATFDLNLNSAVSATSTSSVGGGNATSTFASGKLTSTFTTTGMRLVFPLTEEQIALLGTGADAQTDIYVKIEGTVKTDGDPSGNLFRYSLAQKDAGSAWNSTTLPGGKLEEILFKKVTWNPTGGNSAPDSFILQHGNGGGSPNNNEITIEITKITIGYMAGATVTGIAVKTEPTNNIYQVSVTPFDPSGLVITATYSDNTTRDVAYAHDAGFTFSMTAGGGAAIPLTPGTTTFSATGDVTITVTYEGASTTYTATVSADAPPKVVSFVVKTQPTKTAYKKGIDSFNPAGLVITATYDKALPGGETTRDISYDTNADDFEFANGTTDLEVHESKFNTTGSITITVTYEEVDSTFTITVADISAIAVKTPPTLTSYEVGVDKFSAAGLVITATYGAAGNEDVTYAGHTADFAFSTEEGDLTVGTSTFDAIEAAVEITVTYKTLTTTFNIAVTAVVTGPVWTPVINESTALNGSGEYIGQTGIKRDSAASEIAFGVLDDAFTVTVTNGQYKQFTVQVGTAAGGTNFWCNDGFIAKTGKSYTITFMVSVDSTTATGQIRAGANNNTGNWDKDQALTATPTAFTYTWTQGSGNLKFDTGNTAVDGVITITGISISAN